jgi:hypothetical protein
MTPFDQKSIFPAILCVRWLRHVKGNTLVWSPTL